MRSGHNNLSLSLTSGTSTVYVDDLPLAGGVRFDTLYPGGLFGRAELYIPRDVTRFLAADLTHKLQIRNGLSIVYEGRIVNIQRQADRDTQGVYLAALGYWADVLMVRKWRKPWADGRLDQWRLPAEPYDSSDLSLTEIVQVDTNDRLRFTPKAEAFGNADYASLVYTAPTGETVKRVTFDYDLQEAGQAWELALRNEGTGADVWSQVSSGTGTVDHTLATPSQIVHFLFRSKAAQTPPSDGTIYGQLTAVVVYTETGAISPAEVVNDVRGEATELSASEGLIAANTLDISPFVSDVDTLADILTNAAGYGDGSGNPWAVGVRESDLASDSKPVIFLEQQPVLTANEYSIRLDDENLVPPVVFEQDISTVKNWIAVSYTTPGGERKWYTPDDDSALLDATSITAYGQRQEWIDVNTTTAAQAKVYGLRYKARWKDPQWVVSGDIAVQGYIRGTGQERIPSSQIRAGTRVKIENFLSDLSGTGLTLLVTGTSYEDDGEICRLSTGRPHRLDFWLERNL